MRVLLPDLVGGAVAAAAAVPGDGAPVAVLSNNGVILAAAQFSFSVVAKLAPVLLIL